MEQFVKHKKEWFLNRVGEMVDREYTSATPQSEKEKPLAKSINICSEPHALACYNYHIDKKVNFNEPTKENGSHVARTAQNKEHQTQKTPAG